MPVVACAFVAMWGFYLAFQKQKAKPGHSRAAEIAVKCAATAMAVLVALLGCLRHGAPARWVLLAGLVACAIADGVLCVRFLAGGALFALGHVLYMAAFWMTRRPDWRSAAVFLGLMGLALAGLLRFRARLGGRWPLFIAYAALLSLMAAMAAVQAPLAFAGALLFALSDALLGVLLAIGGGKRLDYISLAAYYLGQFLLGLAVWAG